MKQVPRSTLLTLAAVCLLAAAWHVHADDDHERARRAFEAGEIVSLGNIIGRVERDFDGEILEVELEDEGRRGFVYEVKLLTSGGAVVELLFDAGTGELLRSKGGESVRSGHDDRHEDAKDDD